MGQKLEIVKILKLRYSLVNLMRGITVLLAKRNKMGLFSRKSEKEKLQDKYRKLLEESHRLSTTNRAESDKKAAEADELARRIEQMD